MLPESRNNVFCLARARQKKKENQLFSSVPNGSGTSHYARRQLGLNAFIFLQIERRAHFLKIHGRMTAMLYALRFSGICSLLASLFLIVKIVILGSSNYLILVASLCWGITCLFYYLQDVQRNRIANFKLKYRN